MIAQDSIKTVNLGLAERQSQNTVANFFYLSWEVKIFRVLAVSESKQERTMTKPQNCKSFIQNTTLHYVLCEFLCLLRFTTFPCNQDKQEWFKASIDNKRLTHMMYPQNFEFGQFTTVSYCQTFTPQCILIFHMARFPLLTQADYIE